ncbi:MAG: iron ABC transporter permease [Bacteroidales bacterium]|nr:iron ABC transporter permease [Bacteroidales bacterium]
MNSIRSIGLLILIPVFFTLDLLFGSVQIPFDVYKDILIGNDTSSLWYSIIFDMRLPRAIAALLTGMALPISGLLMQTMFRNPLADPYVLGVSTGGSLGVALFSLAGGISAGLLSSFAGSIGLAISALIGSAIVILIITALAPRVKDSASLLIIGIMFGSVTSAIVSVLQYFSNPDEVHAFVLWTMGSFSNITFTELCIMAMCIIPTTIATLLIHKPLNALLLGEIYAQGLGVKTSRLRLIMILLSAILASIVTAFAGPIGFIGMTVPHIARFMFHTSEHKSLIINSLLIGINLMLGCDLLSQLPGFQSTLPINTVTALFGAPIVILVIYKGQKKSNF